MANVTDELIMRYFKAVADELGYPTTGEYVTIDHVTGCKHPHLVVEQDCNGIWSMWIVGAYQHPQCAALRCTSYAEFGGNSTGMTSEEFTAYLRGIMAATREHKYNASVRFVKSTVGD